MISHSDGHDLFGECFLLTKSFVVLVQLWSEGRMLENSCVGHRAFETVVGKTCLVSQSVCATVRTLEGVLPSLPSGFVLGLVKTPTPLWTLHQDQHQLC